LFTNLITNIDNNFCNFVDHLNKQSKNLFEIKIVNLD